jgi:hypothetical protein
MPFTNQKVWSMTQLLSFMKLSPYISCKKAALNGMGPFFDELEEMQEQATDAVYDLCEDADSDVSDPPIVVHFERFALQGTKYSRNWLRVIIHGQHVTLMYWSSFYKAVRVWTQNCDRIEYANASEQRTTMNFQLSVSL